MQDQTTSEMKRPIESLQKPFSKFDANLKKTEERQLRTPLHPHPHPKSFYDKTGVEH